MTRVLLVTGARSLADDPAAERWARGLIREALGGVDTLLVGDATGPDRWAAWDGAVTVRNEVRVYATRGRNAGWIIAPDDEGDALVCGVWAVDDNTHPLARNAAMVRHAARVRDAGHDVRALALLDGRKDGARGRVTRDAEHTAGLAERAGLAVTRHVWRDDAPGGV